MNLCVEMKPNPQEEASLENEPVIGPDAGTQVLIAVEEALRPSDDVPGLPESASTQQETRGNRTHDLTGTHHDETGDGETMATESW